jgi:HD-GYP domain-containing protein (c-di-GMP phosphodiesterase class II)
MTITDAAAPASSPVVIPEQRPNTTLPAMGAIRLLLETMRMRDPALADHGLRTAHMAAALAEELGATADEIEHSYMGALLHDIGKLGIAESILWKPAGLDSSEWDTIRTHPELGHRLVVDIVHETVAASVLYHHERFDAQGYPYGIDLRTLPMEVRVVQVADAYDALTSDRPYEAPVTPPAAVGEITRCSGTQFDPEVVHVLHRVFDTTIGLNDDITALAELNGMPADPFA